MKTIEKKTTYRTCDGREFTDQAAAAKHEALVVARREYDAARWNLAKLLAEACTTADGQPFQFGLMLALLLLPKLRVTSACGLLFLLGLERDVGLGRPGRRRHRLGRRHRLDHLGRRGWRGLRRRDRRFRHSRRRRPLGGHRQGTPQVGVDGDFR